MKHAFHGLEGHDSILLLWALLESTVWDVISPCCSSRPNGSAERIALSPGRPPWTTRRARGVPHALASVNVTAPFPESKKLAGVFQTTPRVSTGKKPLPDGEERAADLSQGRAR